MKLLNKYMLRTFNELKYLQNLVKYHNLSTIDRDKPR